MTQAEIARRLHRLHFEDRWSKAQLALASGLSRPTIDRAMDGFMTDATQRRLRSMLGTLPKTAPKRKKGLGKKRRFLMRLFNLKRWISLIEYHSGVKKFKEHKYKDLTREEAGYICTKLDYKLKWYLLHIFSASLKAKKVSLGDCYPAEQWIKKIKHTFPREREEMMKDLTRRER